ncbi:MAG: helix-turn-helix domain-containing protein [Acutalibacteraceae bacterium]
MDTSFANRLTDLRKSAQLSQKDAAKGLGISQALLSHYEKGIRECGLSFVVRAAEYYGVTCDYLLGVHSVKTGLHEGFFTKEDIPEDKKLDSLTVFRISSVLHERLRNRPSSYGDIFIQYFSLSMYRFLISAVRAGNLPQNWTGGNTVVGTDIYYECICGLQNTLVNSLENDSSRIDDEEPPQCIKTLIDEVEKYVLEQIDRIYKPLEE